MGYKSKATKINKAKKVDRPPIKRVAEGRPFVVRTDLPPKKGYGLTGCNASGRVANDIAEEMTMWLVTEGHMKNH